MRKLMIAAAALAAVSVPASAQLVGGGLVVVNVSNVANNIARDLNVNVSNVPVTVQVPVGIAAAVCGIDANVLATSRKRDTNYSCTAENTSDALNRIVQRQMSAQQ